MKIFTRSFLLLVTTLMIGITAATAQWSYQTNPLGSGPGDTTATVGKVQFVSSQEGWISAYNGSLLHTTNGGDTWSVVTPFSSETVFSFADPSWNLQFLNADTGWVLENIGTSFDDVSGSEVFYTTDGGTTWKKSILSQTKGDLGAEIQFVDANNGFSALFNIQTGTGSLYKTTDGGVTWNQVGSSIPIGDEAYKFYFVNATTGWMLENNDNPSKFDILKTTDGGVTWTTQYVDNSSHGVDTLTNSQDIQFVDANTGWAVGPNSRIVKTTDGGTTWTTVTSSLTQGLNTYQKTLFMYDANHIWISEGVPAASGQYAGESQSHFLMHTNDGGNTWIKDNISLSNAVFSIYFWDLNHGWLTGDSWENSNSIAAYKNTTAASVNISAGGLYAALTSNQLKTTTTLTITGTIDARDFRIMRDSMPDLTTIDLSGVSIASYTGIEGTAGSDNITYAAHEIPKYAFFFLSKWEGKESLTSVILPPTLTSIGYWAFVDTPNLSITIPASVTYIEDQAFSSSGFISVESANPDFSSLNGGLFNKDQTLLMHVPMHNTNYTIPSTVDTIGVAVFVYNEMTTINIPTSVKVIEKYAFEYCSGLTTITFPEGIQSIGDWAVADCKNLTTVTLPSTLEYIHYCAFVDNPKLSAFSVAANNPYFSVNDGVLFNKNQTDLVFFPDGKTTDYQIPDGTTTIDTAAFEASQTLQSVKIPSSVTTLEQEAFANCTGLTSVTIPSSVTAMGKYEFFDCTGLTSINANATDPIPLGADDSTFVYVDKTNCTLYVPTGSKTKYETANQWKDFTNIVEHTVSATTKIIASSIKVFVQNNLIVVEGAPTGETITVYNLSGIKLYSQIAAGETMTFHISTAGVYIVTVGDQSFKVIKN